jgi:hypothetical protein
VFEGLIFTEFRVGFGPFKVIEREVWFFVMFFVGLLHFLAVDPSASVAFGVREIDQWTFPFDVSAAE